MKKIFALIPFLQVALFALYEGNPAEPQIIDQGFFISQDSLFSVKVGYQGDWVLDRKLRSVDESHGRIDQFCMRMDQGVVTLNCLDRIELYTNVGSMTATFWHRPHFDNQRREYQSHDRWTLGGGLRILLMQWGNTCLGVDGKLQYGAPHLKWITVNGVSFGTGADFTYREWQVSLALSHTVDIFTPYIGATYSNVHVHVDGLKHTVFPNSHFKMVSRDHFGMALGCTLSSGKKVDLNFEVRLFDEQAVIAAGNVKF